MPKVTITADYPDWANPDAEQLHFEENAQRLAQALTDRGYQNVDVSTTYPKSSQTQATAKE